MIWSKIHTFKSEGHISSTITFCKKNRFPIVCAILNVFFSLNKSEVALEDCRIQSAYSFNYEDNMIHTEGVRGNLGRKKQFDMEVNVKWNK